MENKINIAILLKNCPTGMELDSPMYDNLYFDKVEEDYRLPISCYTMYHGSKTSVYFTEFGSYNEHKTSKCVIFPKGKTTWEGFHRPFKDGDVVATNSGAWLGIITGVGEKGGGMPSYCVIKGDGTFEAYLDIKREWYFSRLATEEERQKLFEVINDNGYTWNSKTKTLEKLIQPQFKVGNVIQDKDGYKVRVTEVNIEDECYGYESVIVKGIGGISFREQDDWELVPNKFDISALKPFDKVLVRYSILEKWRIQFFEKYDKTYQYPFICIGCNKYRQCIPYEGNEHLHDKTDDCQDFYKTW